MNIFFQKQEKQKQKPILVVAIDQSESIVANMISDSLGIEIEQLTKQLKSSMEADYQIDLLAFTDKIYENPSFNFNGKRTDMGKLLKYIEDKYYMLPLEAVVLISDGWFNQGQNPVNLLDASPQLVYPVVVGDTVQTADIAIDDIFYNKVVKQNASFPIEIYLEARYFKDEKINVSLFKNNRIISQQEVYPAADNQSIELRFDHTENKPGLNKYVLEIGSELDERNVANNRAEIFVQIIETGQKILVLGQSPHPDISAIASALKNIEGIETVVKTLVDYPFSIDDFDLFILHGLPSKDSRSKSLFQNKNLKSKGKWYIWTSSTDLAYKDFPFLVSKNKTYEYVEAIAEEDFNDFILADNWNTEFNNYPPLYTPYVEYSQKKKMTYLFTQSIRGYDSGKPLWGFWSGNGTNNSILMGEGIWKWKLYDFRNNKNHNNFNDLINRVSKYLLTGLYKDRFNVQFRNSYNETDQVLIEAQLLNKAFENMPNAQISFTLKDEDKNEYPYQFTSHESKYSLNLGNLESGIYSFVAKAVAPDTLLSEKGTFVVQSWNMELSKTDANIDIMKKLAVGSGGKTYALSQTTLLENELKEKLNTSQRYTYIQKIVNMIDLELILLLLVLLLAAEWFLRKYFGRY